MALSGSANFQLNVTEVIQEAYDRIGGDPILGYDVRSARRSLNIMFTDWANRGYNQWTVELETLSLVQGTNQYTLPADTIDIVESSIRRNEGGTNTDYFMTRLSLGDYEAIGVKSTQSLPTQYFLQRLSTPVLFLYPTPINSTDVMRYWRIRRIEDITANTVNGVDQNVDVPSRWIEAMCSGLAYFLGKKRPGIDGNMRAELKLDYEEAFSRAQSADSTPTTRIVPGYGRAI